MMNKAIFITILSCLSAWQASTQTFATGLNFDDAAYATLEAGDGTGLGLPLTRKLAEAAGGKLTIDADASGTRARITFRRAKRR